MYAYGGTRDHTLNHAVDRVADVFPDDETLTAAGYHSQADCDLLAVTGPAPVGITANRIPGHRRILAGRSFRSWQHECDQRRRARGPRRAQVSFRCFQPWPGHDHVV